MTASKPLPLRRKRRELKAVGSDPRELVALDVREQVQKNLEQMSKQHSDAETSAAPKTLH